MTHLKCIILLHTVSTFHLFMNKALVSNISHSINTLQLETNGGKKVSNLESTLGNAKTWFNDKAIANVLIHSLLADYFHVVSNYLYHSSFFVCIGDKDWMEFVPLGCSLHACDVKDKLNFCNPKFLTYSLEQTACENEDTFSTRQIQCANQIRKLHAKIGRLGV